MLGGEKWGGGDEDWGRGERDDSLAHRWGFVSRSRPVPRSAHLTSAALQFGVGRSPYKKSQEKIFLCASTTKIFS